MIMVHCHLSRQVTLGPTGTWTDPTAGTEGVMTAHDTMSGSANIGVGSYICCYSPFLFYFHFWISGLFDINKVPPNDFSPVIIRNVKYAIVACQHNSLGILTSFWLHLATGTTWSAHLPQRYGCCRRHSSRDC